MTIQRFQVLDGKLMDTFLKNEVPWTREEVAFEMNLMHNSMTLHNEGRWVDAKKQKPAKVGRYPVVCDDHHVQSLTLSNWDGSEWDCERVILWCHLPFEVA